jgi:hypothetical protein
MYCQVQNRLTVGTASLGADFNPLKKPKQFNVSRPALSNGRRAFKVKKEEKKCTANNMKIQHPLRCVECV